MGRAITASLFALSTIHNRGMFSLYIAGDGSHRWDGHQGARTSSNGEATPQLFLQKKNRDRVFYSLFGGKGLGFVDPPTSQNAVLVYL